MLPVDIDTFKSTLAKRGGLAKTNYFSIYMTTPILNLSLDNALSNVVSGNLNPMQAFNDPRDITLLCESCTLPGRQIATNEYATMKHATKKPYGYINEDVTFTFLLTEDYYMKDVMDAWQAQIIDFKTNRLRYKGNYARDIVIQQLSSKGTPIYTVKLLNAFPVSVNGIELSNTGENTVQKVTVTMAYDDWTNEGLIDGALDVVDSIADGISQTKDELGSVYSSARKVFGKLPKLF